MLLENSGPQLTNDDLDGFEKEYQVSLPQDYRHFMLEHNGGDRAEFMVFDFIETGYGDNSTDMREFNSIHIGEVQEQNDIRRPLMIVRAEGYAPSYFIPIGNDSGGSPIFLAAGSEDIGCVYIANDNYEDTETGYFVMSKVADSFTEFIDMLYTDEEA
jgi:cell wall assembly regulator SMI1